MSFKITGTGKCVPEMILTNDDLSKIVETSDEWITQRVGVKERRICTTETASDLAYGAAALALDNAKTSADEIDLIIASTLSSDSICPTIGGFVQNKIGAKCPAFDINSACSGFIFALECASSFFAMGKYKKILVVAAEKISRIIDYTDRNTCVIFGDGAGAAVLERGDNFLASKISTMGDDSVINIPNYKSVSPFDKVDFGGAFVDMKGQETFKFAVTTMTNDVKEVLAQANLTIDDVKYIVPHQANVRILQFASKKLGIDIEKVFCNIENYGNTSSASVIIALDELNRSGKLQQGDIIVLTAFGGGLSAGACVLRW